MTTRPTPHLVLAAAAALLAAAPGGARAEGCTAPAAGDALTGEQARAVYDCLREAMHEGYASGDKRWIPASFVEDYRDWTPASTFPAAPGFHGGRFLLTWVNDTGFEAYTRYAESPDIPAGTVIAKESFAVAEDGRATPGPLFLMRKVEAGTSPETMDWHYMAVAPSGEPMAVDVMSACNQCHVGTYDAQGGLGYPVEEARLGQ